jgi:hypothetical protein
MIPELLGLPMVLAEHCILGPKIYIASDFKKRLVGRELMCLEYRN